MNKISGVMVCCSTVFLFALCSQSDNASYSKLHKEKQVTVDTSYFPLIPGSAYHYEEYLNGELQQGNMILDSVTEVAVTDTGVLCKIQRTACGESPENRFYFVTSSKAVYQIDAGGARSLFCYLFPKPAMVVDERMYSSFLDQENKRIRLETTNFETAGYEEQMEWQGTVFERGVGVVSYGGAELGMELIDYHLGSRGGLVVCKSDSLIKRICN